MALHPLDRRAGGGRPLARAPPRGPRFSFAGDLLPLPPVNTFDVDQTFFDSTSHRGFLRDHVDVLDSGPDVMACHSVCPGHVRGQKRHRHLHLPECKLPCPGWFFFRFYARRLDRESRKHVKGLRTVRVDRYPPPGPGPCLKWRLVRLKGLCEKVLKLGGRGAGPERPPAGPLRREDRRRMPAAADDTARDLDHPGWGRWGRRGPLALGHHDDLADARPDAMHTDRLGRLAARASKHYRHSHLPSCKLPSPASFFDRAPVRRVRRDVLDKL